jgi:hypothetical protein
VRIRGAAYGRTGKPDILDANNVEIGLPQQQAEHDVTVEVLVREKP